MSAIFLSYRRGDTAGHAGRLVDRLRNTFPDTRVFMDVDTIRPGVDFVSVIEENIAACDVVLALIGDEWLNMPDAKGIRRLDDPSDFVRLELAAALKRRVPVIPVLVERAAMPTADQLPPELSRLARINALEITDNRWDYDVGRLFEAIEEAGVSRPSPSPHRSRRPAQDAPRARATTARRRLPLGIVVGLAVLLVAGGLFAVLSGGDNDTPAGQATPEAPTSSEPVATPPLLVDVRTNIDDFDRRGIAHVPEFVTTRPIAQVGAPPNVRLERVINSFSDVNETGRWAWAHEMGAVDANETLLRVTIQGRDDAPVILQRVDVVVLERNPPLAGSNLSYTGLGSATTPNTLNVDLDQNPPETVYIDETRKEQRAFTFSVSRTDIEVLNILASTGTCDCTWVIKLKFTAAGRAGELTIDDGGKPFRTTATANTQHCYWNGTAWVCSSR